MVMRLNRMRSGWSNYFYLGQVRPAYRMIDGQTAKWLLEMEIWLGLRDRRSAKAAR